MYIAYSAIDPFQKQQISSAEQDNERLLRYQAYQEACNKYRQEIAAIQKYLPGWLPKFR
jgi:hypothetical protein